MIKKVEIYSVYNFNNSILELIFEMVIVKLAAKDLVQMGKYNTPTKLGQTLKSLSYKPSYSDKRIRQIWASSDDRDIFGQSGLGCSILMAYSYHRILSISPDDFWLHITQQVGKHIETNSEDYRDNFVSHQGKQEISVSIDEEVAQYGRCDHRTWKSGIEQITEKLKFLVKGDTVSTFLGEFSTTTPVTLTANQIVLMNALKNYFSYKMCTECGIPSVEMKGTREDWVQLIEKTKKLDALVSINGKVGSVVNGWLKNLYPVLNNLLLTYDNGNVQDWWSHVADEKQTFGSGGTTRYYGWITKLFLYNSKGTIFTHRDNEIDDFPSGTCTCPFIFDDNGTEFKLNLVAGNCGSEIRQSDGAVIPAIGWAVVDRIE